MISETLHDGSPPLVDAAPLICAEELGLVRMLDEDRDGKSTDAMIAAIRALPDQPPPSEAGADGLLDGCSDGVAEG